MSEVAFIAAFGLAAFLIAWVVNGLVGMMSGENPRDTGRLGAEIFLRFFAILELGIIGRVLGYLGFTGWPRKLMLFVGLLCILAFLIRAGHHTGRDNSAVYKQFGITNGQVYEITNHCIVSA